MYKMFCLALLATAGLEAQPVTRGVGVYPGQPEEDFSPTLVVEKENYRNLALRRPAYHSSAYDYNLTAQLVTDGIKDARLPRWIVVSSSQQGVLKKNEREWPLDDNWVSSVDVKGRHAWVQVEFAGAEPPVIDRVKVDGSVKAPPDNQDWSVTVLVSSDGKSWRAAGHGEGMARPTGEIKPEIRFSAPSKERFYRLQFDAGRTLAWTIGEIAFFEGARQVQAAGPYSFTSAWKSAGAGEEWVAVDLGARCSFDRVSLSWIRRAAEGALQISDDGKAWKTIEPLRGDDIKLSQPAVARWVRVLMTKPEDAVGYILSELEVFGRGGPLPQAKPAPMPRATRQDLAGGGWRVQRDSLVAVDGAALSRVGFADRDWVVATVPGTVLVSYWRAGALPDPNFSDNQLMISDSFFYADFWYRTEFQAAQPAAGKRQWLNFDGINWKADVYLNGARLGRIEGGFVRARFDVTGKLLAGPNAVAVRIEKNATPGSVKEKTFENPDKNGGAPGADNPTYHASIGWDWIPTVRGRDTGIWNDVYVTTTGGVTLENPAVSSKLALPDTSLATVTVGATLRNSDTTPFSGTLRGRFGDSAFEVPVSLGAGETKAFSKDLALKSPKLWWPADYGPQNLYAVELAVGDSDAKRFQAGVREFSYSDEGGKLRMWINGRRFIPRGGNWGFPESMLLYRGREYDAAVRYHADMHFNMIRNWVGQTGDDEFYEACDRHGIVVWQDFWLANPWDGPEPNDNEMFVRNVRDTIARIRTHPSVGLYCGRNEGYPLKPLDDSIRASLDELHPGIHYISSSADDVVSGHGPYRAQGTRAYFEQRATPQFHSEMGMPNIVTYDSLKLMMKPEEMWPQGRLWGLHDFCLQGAQGGASFRERIDKGYGGAANAEEWVTLAQFVNYEGHRAMFEAQSKNRMGLLIWMSHPAWPSQVWQTYDYYFEPTAGYFGAKKGSEPLHIQWNPATDHVEVVNYNAGNAKALTARAELLNMDGSLVWHKEATLDSAEDSLAAPIKLEYPTTLSAVHFIRLKLTRGGEVVSENFYWRGKEEGQFRALRSLPKVKLEAATKAERQGARWVLTTRLHNPGPQPALLVRVKAVRAQSGDRILPALYSDNYIALMPGEQKTIRTELNDADARGEQPRIAVEGFNTGTVTER